MHPLFQILNKLDAAKRHYRIFRSRSDTLTIAVTPMAGLRLEIDVFEDGHIEYSKFEGDEAVIEDNAALYQLIDDVVALDRKYEALLREKLKRE